jgi:hypothetical protein
MESKETVTVRRISAEEAERWDSLVDASPQGTVFHTWAWVSTVASHARMSLLGQTLKPVFHPLIAEYKGRDIGLIPLYEFKGQFLKYVFSPPPNTYLTYLGPCLNFPEGLGQTTWETLHRKFHNALTEYLRSIGAHCVCIHTPPGYEDMRPYLWQGYQVTPLYNYVIDLKKPLEEILPKSNSDFKRNLRKAEKDNYTISEGSSQDVEKLYQLHSLRYAQQDIDIPVTIEYLQDLWEVMHPKRLQMIKAELNGEFISASIQTCFKGKVSAWFGSPKITQMGLGANDLIKWTIIKSAASNGYTEFEEIWANEERLNRFKTKLDPSLNFCYSVVWMNTPLTIAYAVRKFLIGGKIWGANL